MPEITGLSNEQIQSRIAEIVSDFAALNLTVSSSEEDIAKGEALADEVRALRAEQDARKAKEGRLAELGEAFSQPQPQPEPEPEPAPEEQPPAEPGDDDESDDEEPEAAPVAEAVEEKPAKEKPLPVAAAVRTSPARRAAANAPEVKMPKPTSTSVITAAADVPNYSAGQVFADLTEAAQALESRARSMPTGYQDNTRLRYGAIKIQRTGYGNLVQGADLDGDDLIKAACDESRLPGGSLALTADAWCAPSDTSYDFCQFEGVAGILSVPEFRVTRGGIRTTTGIDYSSIYSDPDFYFHIDPSGVITDGDGTVVTTKPCGTIACPTFVDNRLSVDGVCISVDILQNVGYPELTRRVMEGVAVAHAHRMNAQTIGTIQVAAGSAILVPDNDTLLFNLDYLEWYAVMMRAHYSLAENATIEVVVPFWMKPLVRAEVSRRTGVDLINPSDGFISSYFSTRGLSVQYVQDWQVLTGLPGAVAIPTTVDVLMYPAGSWTRGTQAVISMDAIYDSTLLRQNKYLGLFTEEASLLIQRCLGTTRLTVPIKVSGLSGATQTVVLGV